MFLSNVSLNLIQFLIYVGAFSFGFLNFFKKKCPLYFKLILLGCGCFLLQEVYYLSYYLCVGEWANGFSFASFGSGGCYAFLLSANYGQFDGIVDDRSGSSKNARTVAFLAPIALFIIFIIPSVKYVKSALGLTYPLLILLSKFPAFFACYFHLKHLILEDALDFLIKPLRGYNFFALLLIFSDFMLYLFSIYNIDFMVRVMEWLIPIALFLMMIYSNKGYKEWKI